MTEIGAGIGYGMQKFHESLNALIRPESIQERLRYVAGSLFYLNPESHLPKYLRDEFKELRETVWRWEELSEAEASDAAERVLEMARKVDVEYLSWADSVMKL